MRVLLATVALLLCSSAGAAAAKPGYSLDEDRWSGVGYLLQTAREAKVELEVLHGTVDLKSLRPDDVVLWLYPRGEVPVQQLVRFVWDGGALVVADDQGSAAPLLRAFGVQRLASGPSRHTTFFRGLAGLPVVKPKHDREHFLYFNVKQIVANHPAILRGGTPVYSFETPPGGPGEHLVVETSAGRGRFMAIGDPSVFINDMIGRSELHGNKQFAANVMRRNCSRDCRVKLLLPTVELTGTYHERGGPLGELPRMFDDAATLLNASLLEASAALGEAPWSWLVVFLLSVLGGLIISRTLGHLGPRPKQPMLGEGSAQPTVSPLVHEALGLSHNRNDADFGHLARTLLAQVEGLRSAGKTPDEAIAPGDVAADAITLARRAMLRIEQDAASFHGGGESPVISSERFLRLYDDVRLIARYATAQRRGSRPRRHGTPTAKENDVRT